MTRTWELGFIDIDMIYGANERLINFFVDKLVSKKDGLYITYSPSRFNSICASKHLKSIKSINPSSSSSLDPKSFLSYPPHPVNDTCSCYLLQRGVWC